MPMRDPARQPEAFSSFVGRRLEVDELRALLHSLRAVTLCGAGGIGKSRLALRLLDIVAPEFPDGAWFVELGDLRQPELVVPRVASIVGVGEEPGRPLLDTLADSFRYRRVLLVLDNCEHLIDACASLCQRLLASSPGLRVVATSREPLRVAAETVWPVPPLELPPEDSQDLDVFRRYDAIGLFAERAAAAAPGFAIGPANIASVAAICRALDGLPLAIELAAAWVRVLSVEQIAARLDRRLALLTSRDRTVPARQQTLRATFDWSYDLLSEPQRILLRRLAGLAGWSLDMAEQVCAGDGLQAADILDLLTGLADKSLLEVEPEALGEARYRLLETVREYARGWLDQAGETALIARRRREYTLAECERSYEIGMAIVAAPWSARVDVFRRIDLETANLREVLAGCVADGDVATGLRICTAISPVWLVRGTFAEGAAWIDGLLELPDAASVPAAVRGPALVARAQLALAMGSERTGLVATGLELCSEAGEKFWVAAALNLLTEIALHSGQADEAAAWVAQALQVARSSGDHWNEGYALGTMASAAAGRGNLREAEQLGEDALAVMRAIDQLWGAARMLLGLGDLARLREQNDIASDHYLAALVVLREVSARPEIARCLAGLGRIALAQSDVNAARRYLTESLQLSFASGSRIGIARGLEAMARLALLEHNPQLAVQLGGAVSALRAEAHLPPLPGARSQRFLDAAAGLGEHAVARLWQDGAGLTPAAAVRLALNETGGSDQGMTRARAGPDALAGGLTAREHQVVGLLGAGLSNRDIAAKLYISPATAARHVANILAKLGFSSRSQVAVWANRRDEGPD
ncbi:MAG TPA: tetratricopeptide repeat protein [Streptosporangiaceae bacterium]|nr:tetratricopeptide repeat protein [Streptosporangiaceae bacterium]